jgi:hypothetical protein
MGINPREVGSMMLWEFMACIEEFAAMHGAKGRMTDDEVDQAAALLDAAPDTVTD